MSQDDLTRKIELEAIFKMDISVVEKKTCGCGKWLTIVSFPTAPNIISKASTGASVPEPRLRLRPWKKTSLTA